MSHPVPRPPSPPRSAAPPEPWPWLEGPFLEADDPPEAAFEAFASAEGLAASADAPAAGPIPDFEALGSVVFPPAEIDAGVRAYCARALVRAGGDRRRRAGWRAARHAPPAALPWLGTEDPASGRRWALVDPRCGTERAVCWVGASGARLFRVATVPGYEGFVLLAETPFPGGFWRSAFAPRVLSGGGLELVAAGRGHGDPGCYACFRATPAAPRRALRLPWSERLVLRAKDGTTVIRWERRYAGWPCARAWVRVDDGGAAGAA